MGNLWIETYTGKLFFYDTPQESEVCIEDIAHGLSLNCRYTGQCREFYSVAQHSVLMTTMVIGGRLIKMDCLMHDAVEAYTGDLPSPFKKLLGDAYSEWAMLWRIYQKLGLRWPRPDTFRVDQADMLIRCVEVRDLMPNIGDRWRRVTWANDVLWKRSEKIPRIEPWAPVQAEREFLDCWEKLNQEKGKPFMTEGGGCDA